MISRALAGATLLAVIGCAGDVAAFIPPSDYVVYVSPAAAQVGALQALQDWTMWTGVHFTVGVTEATCDEPWDCFSVAMASPAEVQARCIPGAVGCTSGSQCVVSDNLAPDQTMHTFRHEIGHALGLVHVQSAGELMYPSLDGSSVITPGDVAQYRSLRAVRPAPSGATGT